MARGSWRHQLVRRLPRTAADLAFDLHHRIRHGTRPIDSKSFFESVYQSNPAFEDRYTIGHKIPRLGALYHYKSVERNILHALHALDPSWFHRPESLDVLDIGSGTGHWIRFYVEEIGVRHVTGVDLSESAVEGLRERFADAENVDARAGDVSEEKVDLERRFDLVNAIGVLFHVVEDDRWLQAIRTLARHLKPGGGGVVSGRFDSFTRNVHFTRAESFSSWDEHDERTRREGGELLVYKRLRSRRKWRRALRRAGCELVTVLPAHARLFTPDNNLLVFRKSR